MMDKKFILVAILFFINILMFEASSTYIFAQASTDQAQTKNVFQTDQAIEATAANSKETTSETDQVQAENLSKTDQLLQEANKGTDQSAEALNLQSSSEKDAGKSEIENILSGQFPREITKKIDQYGYSFFAKGSPTFGPVVNVPVGNDYIIGPGDGFTINLWGNAEETYKASVTRDGNITLPRLGTLNVNSLSFAELKELLGHKFKEYYPDFEMNITMDSLRTIDIPSALYPR
jgi:hypothetical protein